MTTVKNQNGHSSQMVFNNVGKNACLWGSILRKNDIVKELNLLACGFSFLG